jgi:hypothetical protein
VYVPVVVLSTVAGDHVPLIPFVDVAGKVGAGDPVQIGASAVNIGVTFGLTVCTNVVVTAHWPLFGVKVYVPVVVLSTVAGLHTPAILLVDDVGNAGAAEPLQIAASAVNVGVTVPDVTVCIKVVVVAHWPASGVNV